MLQRWRRYAPVVFVSALLFLWRMREPCEHNLGDRPLVNDVVQEGVQCNYADLVHGSMVFKAGAGRDSYTVFTHPPAEDTIISASVQTGRPFETWMHSIFVEVLSQSPGGIVVDVGANIGIHTLFLASKGYEVFACEALARNADLLECSIAANGFDNVHVLRAALLSHLDSHNLCIFPFLGNLGHSMVSECLGRGEETPIETTTFDAWKNSAFPNKRITLLKLDVEGFEPHVIEGGSQMFEGPAPPLYVMMEFYPRYIAMAGRDPHAFLVDLVEQLGYTPVDARHLVMIPDLHLWAMNTSLADVLLIHRDAPSIDLEALRMRRTAEQRT